MITQTIAFIFGIVVGQEAGLPAVRPILRTFYNECWKTLTPNEHEQAHKSIFQESLQELLEKFKKD